MMHYFFQDLIGVAAATPLSLLLLLMPGFGIARLIARTGIIAEQGPNRSCWNLLLGPTMLPAVDALVLRSAGFGGVMAVHTVLAAVGARPAMESARRLSAGWWLVILACWVAAAWANVDFDWGGRLYQSASVVDGVKHAAVIGSLARSGIPLHDPFFSRPGIAGYYYYFYIGPALVHWLGAPLVDSRAAFAAATFITLLALPATLILVADAAALIPQQARRRFVKLLLLLCCVSGLDLLPALWMWASMGHLLAQLDWWDEEVRWALMSVLWEPHHMTAVIAVFTGCLVISSSERSDLGLRAFLAGIAFATAFGCSVWIAIAAVPILALWWLYERVERGPASIWALPLSGAAALFLSLPQLLDVVRGRAAGGPALAFYLRPVGPIRVLPHTIGEWVIHLAVLPGGYLIEFGAFALGSIAFLSRGRFLESRATPIGRLLLVSAPVALILVTFVRSAILYNDFGWRAVWLAQVPAMVWTASVLSSAHERAVRSPVLNGALALGIAATLWDVAGLRLVCPDFFPSFVNAHPEVDYDLRSTYRWADRTVPAEIMIQHDPEGQVRAMDFGLYSDRPVSVSDPEARLFGAPQEAVEHRLAMLTPIFKAVMPMPEIRRRAAAAGVGGILLTSIDPLWRAAAGPPRAWTCDFRSRNSCLMLLEKRK